MKQWFGLLNAPVRQLMERRKGNTEKISLSSSSGRYVRLLCHKRSSQYGASLYELQVFGSARCDDSSEAEEEDEAIHDAPGVADDTGDCDEEPEEKPEEGLETIHNNLPAIHKFIKNGQIYISRNGAVYAIDGRLLMYQEER